MNVLPVARQVEIITCLVDGVGIRATSRLTDADRETVGRLALLVGEGCLRLHDRLFRGLHCSALQLDEQHSWVHTRQPHLKTTDPVDVWGEQWTFVALDIASRAVVSWLIGKRTGDNAATFAKDLRRRVLGAPMLSSDGFKPYIPAVEDAFGLECRYGQLVKEYETRSNGREGNYKGAVPVVIRGKVDKREINTSYVERANLTTRQTARRFGRQTLAHSKKLRNHTAAVGLHFAHYNLARVHTSLRVTPAMQLGVTKHVWTVAELVEAALAEPEPQRTPPVEPERPKESPFQMLLPGMQPALRVVRGGKR